MKIRSTDLSGEWCYKKKLFENKEFPNSDQDFLTWQSCCMDQGRNNWLTFFFLNKYKSNVTNLNIVTLAACTRERRAGQKNLQIQDIFLQFFSNLLIRSRKKGKNLCLKHGIYKRIWCTLHDAWNYSIILGGQ